MKLPQFNKNSLATAVVFAGAMLATQLVQAQPAVVTEATEEALQAALDSGAREIVIATEGDMIVIDDTLTYDGDKPLSIFGSGQTIKAEADVTVLTVTNGASLTVVGVNFMGPGGFDIENQGFGKGVFVDVRDNQNGLVKLVMKNSTVSGVANHGIHVSDCDLADDCGGGGGGSGGGSSASITVELTNVVVDDVGNGKFDADGVRVDERANGNILFRADNSTFTGVGADGIELDEGQNGVVQATVTNSSFTENGTYCDPDLLEEFLPDPAEREEIPEGEVLPEDITPGVTPDSGCFEVEFETHSDGSVSEYEVALDLDDGFDIDEAGNGGVKARIFSTVIENNDDEGLDFDEEDSGGIDLVVVDSEASNNRDDGIKLSEEGPGKVTVLQLATNTFDNGGKGSVFEEADQGDLEAVVENSETGGNDGGDVGIEAVQEDQGTGMLTLTNTTVGETETGDDFPIPGVEAVGVEVIDN